MKYQSTIQDLRADLSAAQFEYTARSKRDSRDQLTAGVAVKRAQKALYKALKEAREGN
jgi:hypothetical protein